LCVRGLQLATKIDGENWPALFESEKSEGDVKNAAKPKLSDAQNEKQMKARAASDLVVLNGFMSKLAPSTRTELDGLLAKGGCLFCLFGYIRDLLFLLVPRRSYENDSKSSTRQNKTTINNNFVNIHSFVSVEIQLSKSSVSYNSP
jgi:hypothetical protein